jgi:hypothetical protein
MPKLVCSKCQIELRPIKNGVVVVEYANNGPYKLWNADEWGCPECEIKIVAGFPIDAYARSYQDGFDDRLKQIYARPDQIRCDFEDIEQRDKILNIGD